MFNEQRQEEILKALEEQGRVSVEELNKSLKVSPSTIRRDLEEMEGKGLLRRTHGGAIRERKERVRGMKIFLDSANIEEIKKAKDFGIIDGVTTNPSSIAREGKDSGALIKEIADIIDGPICMEPVATEVGQIVSEAEKLAKFHKNVVIKIPATPEGLKAVRFLSKKGIKTGVTLVFSSSQALLAAKAGATYCFPFVGRLEDIGQEGMDVVKEIIHIYRNYDFRTEVIVASIRSPLQVEKAALYGAGGVTVPFNVLERLVRHPLTDEGIEKFLADWKKTSK
ncbi:fructose-6-phosphate aldolase [bacterium]|nr:fructose-6-phosphate aldolase [bacterium]